MLKVNLRENQWHCDLTKCYLRITTQIANPCHMQELHYRRVVLQENGGPIGSWTAQLPGQHVTIFYIFFICSHILFSIIDE